MKKFKIKFRSGVERIWEGKDIEDACSKKGYSTFILEDIEFCEEIEGEVVIMEGEIQTRKNPDLIVYDKGPFFSKVLDIVLILDDKGEEHYVYDPWLKDTLVNYPGKKVKIILT